MRVVCSSRGSRGDVHPIIEIAAALAREGHEVKACFPATFSEVVGGRCGESELYPEDSTRVMHGFDQGWKAAAAQALSWFASDMRDQLDRFLAVTEEADALVTSVNELTAQTAAEYRGIQHFRVAYALILPGDQPPPLVPWQGLPSSVNRVMWRLVNSAAGLPVWGLLNEHRRRLGLPAVKDIPSHFAGRSTTLLAISSTLAPPSKEWLFPYRYTGPCLDDNRGRLGPDVMRFLAADRPPVYVGFGSVAVGNPAQVTNMVVEAAERAECRIILGSGWTGLGEGSLPKDVLVVSELPHATLFRHVSGVAHHGGSGTAHTAARAGAPQFVMPQIADQFYWGHRIHELGLGPRPVPPRKLTVRKLSRALRLLAHDQGYSRRAEALATQLAGDGVASAVRAITEESAPSCPSQPGSTCLGVESTRPQAVSKYR